MISLPGLSLATGRHREAGYILRTFGKYVRDGLIPNLFPEGKSEGLYHTADATLWFFHAIDCYVRASNDRMTLPAPLAGLADHPRKAHARYTLWDWGGPQGRSPPPGRRGVSAHVDGREGGGTGSSRRAEEKPSKSMRCSTTRSASPRVGSRRSTGRPRLAPSSTRTSA